MKFYLDEDLSPKIAKILRKQGVDVVSCHEVDMVQASDSEQLEYAVSQGRRLVTRNRNDFIMLTVQFFNDCRPHSGVLIVPHSLPSDRFGLIAKALEVYASKHQKEAGSYSINFLTRTL
ncbi:MAG: DUF5615 family PIN-like protein [Actinobacteria bacterium]|nr:DUF5615 family PIN-like protein [Actinomycetota bacterium]